MFDYEKIILDCLIQTQTHSNNIATDLQQQEDRNNNITKTTKTKHLWIKKATGLGITEFMLRFMAWLCLKDIDSSTMIYLSRE